jgi:hypothetical protein
MEDMKFLKAILAEMNANIKSNQEKADVDRIANREGRKAERKADQENLKRMMEEMNANESKATEQEEMLAEISARMDTNLN